MVFCPIRRVVCEPTGTVRVRLRKGLFGIKPVVERERYVQYHQGLNVLRTEREWMPEKAANVLWRTFYDEKPWQRDE